MKEGKNSMADAIIGTTVVGMSIVAALTGGSALIFVIGVVGAAAWFLASTKH